MNRDRIALHDGDRIRRNGKSDEELTGGRVLLNLVGTSLADLGLTTPATATGPSTLHAGAVRIERIEIRPALIAEIVVREEIIKLVSVIGGILVGRENVTHRVETLSEESYLEILVRKLSHEFGPLVWVRLTTDLL